MEKNYREIEKFDVLDVARYVVNKAIDMKQDITNLRLQKLLYFIQGGYIKEKQMLMFEEEFYAWKFGPVLRSVYNEFKKFGNNKLNKVTSVEVISLENDKIIITENVYAPKLSKDAKNIIGDILKETQDYDTFKLVDITHLQDPWYNVYDSNNMNKVISNESMIEFFGGLNGRS